MDYNIIELAKHIRAIYEKAKEDKFYLFMGSFQFPKNSCEGSSRIFAYIVQNLYLDADVKIIKGYCYSKNEYHYWTLVNGLVYDLTCDQFEDFNSVILGEERTSLSEEFNDTEIFTEENIFDNWNLGSEYDKFQTIDYVEKHLKREYR